MKYLNILFCFIIFTLINLEACSANNLPLDVSDNDSINVLPKAVCISKPTVELSTHSSNMFIDKKNQIAYVEYTSSENSKLEGPNANSYIALSIFPVSNPSKKTIIKVAYPGQRIGNVIIPADKSLSDGNIYTMGDGHLIISFLSLSNYTYYYRRYNLSTGALEDSLDYMKIKYKGEYKPMIGGYFVMAVNEFVGNKLKLPTTYLQMASRAILYNGYFYIYVGGYLGSATNMFRGALLKSIDCINWEVVYVRPTKLGGYSYTETDILIKNGIIYCVQRHDNDNDSGMGTYLFSIDLSTLTAKDDILITPVGAQSTGRPAIFTDGKDIYIGATSGNLVTPTGIVERSEYTIYKIVNITEPLKTERIVLLTNACGIHYCSLCFDNYKLLITYSTDRRKINLSHPCTNIDFISFNWNEIKN